MTSENSKNPVVHMKCRRGYDLTTHGQSCIGMQAEKITPDGSSSVQLRCTLCNYVWVVPVGGSVNL